MKIILSLVVLLFSVDCALGCSYLGYPDPPLSYIIPKWGTIFVGTIVSQKTTYEKDEDGDRYRVKRMKFKVDRTLKGENSEFQELGTLEALVKDSCSSKPTEFKVGEKWVIHKDFDWGTESRRNQLGYSFRRYRMFGAEDSAAYLAEIEKYIENPVSAVYGQMETRLGGQPYKEVEVFLEGNGVRASTKIDKNGRYSFENIPAGTYRVQVRLPAKTYDMFNGRETVFDAQTKTFNFEYEAVIKAGDSDYHYIVFGG